MGTCSALLVPGAFLLLCVNFCSAIPKCESFASSDPAYSWSLFFLSILSSTSHCLCYLLPPQYPFVYHHQILFPAFYNSALILFIFCFLNNINLPWLAPAYYSCNQLGCTNTHENAQTEPYSLQACLASGFAVASWILESLLWSRQICHFSVTFSQDARLHASHSNKSLFSKHSTLYSGNWLQQKTTDTRNCYIYWRLLINTNMYI